MRDFLADLRRHWRLEPHLLEVATDADGQGAIVRISGPFGIHRTARTRVVRATPDRLRGIADVGPATRGSITWALAPSARGTQVTLTAELLRASAMDRVLLAAGGRAWLARILDRAVNALGDAVGAAR